MKHVPDIRGVAQDRARIAVERALAEFRTGRPVVIERDGEAILAVSVEPFDASVVAQVESVAQGAARLVMPAARLRRLGVDRKQPGTIALPVVDAARVERLALHLDARVDAPVSPLAPLDAVALELARIALTLPALVTAPVVAQDAIGRDFVSVPAQAVLDYRAGNVRDLHIVGRAPVPLEGAGDSEFVVFRGGEGMRDQVAIIVGRPDLSKPVTVRLHSACLTGDLFGSLKCDCGDQLRGTVRLMAENEGGILLYLDQEGRGNGIANKMRAYRLQAQGFDTYDADETLGFEQDQRHFDFAAAMLKQLGCTRVRILTNNPEKIAALKAAGLEIVADQRILGRAHEENVRYLASKRDRAGHFIDMDALAAKAGRDD